MPKPSMQKAWKQTVTTLKRERLMTISNMFIMTISFLTLGAFLVIFVFSQTAIRRLEEQAQLTTFFNDDFPEADILKLKTELEADERVFEVEYISKEDAYAIFTQLNKDEPLLLESITASILPASLEIKTTSTNYLADLSAELGKRDGVEEVRFFEDVVDKFRHWTGVANIVGVALVAMFLFISHAVVISTLRTTIKSKGTELSILKLVGATDSYVTNPLVLQGLFFGVGSALLASLIITLVLGILLLQGFLAGSRLYILSFVPGFSIQPVLFIVILFLILTISGYILGYLGSLAAVKKYLKY